jgi:hypothetical protein
MKRSTFESQLLSSVFDLIRAHNVAERQGRARVLAARIMCLPMKPRYLQSSYGPPGVGPYPWKGLPAIDRPKVQDEIAICGQTSVTQMPLPSLARESAPIECQRSSVRAEPSLSVCPITNDYAPPSRNARFLASRVRSACRPDLQDLYTQALMRITSSSHRVQFRGFKGDATLLGSKGTLPFYAERKASRETSVKLFDLPLGEKR